MNILHNCPTYYPATKVGGPIFSLYGMNNALANLPNINLKIITTDGAGPQISDRFSLIDIDRSIYPNQEIIFTRNQGKRNISIGMLFRLPSLISWADIIHLTGVYSFSTIPTLLLCRILNKPIVWSHEGAILEVLTWKEARNKRLKKIWDNFCNFIINPEKTIIHVTSEKEKDASKFRIPKGKIVIIPNGVDIPKKLPNREWKPSGKLRMIFIGRISPIKGLENLLTAIEKLEDLNMNLTIYGEGEANYLSRIKEITKKLRMSRKNIYFAGHVDGDEKEKAFYTADICILPSYSENFGMVIAEALSHGVPVITSTNTPWEAIEKINCGLWVNNDPKSLELAIRKMYHMPLERMGLRGREWMMNCFSLECMAEKMLKAYQSLLN
jgi:glycosyltransferase involved in cell wall biosynthesis